jgi:hypothetical protein
VCANPNKAHLLTSSDAASDLQRRLLLALSSYDERAGHDLCGRLALAGADEDVIAYVHALLRAPDELLAEGARILGVRRKSRLELIGALNAWRQKVGDAPPSAWVIDDLYRAACLECEAIEYERSGLRAAADEAMARVRQLVVDAAEQKRIPPRPAT